MKTTLQKSNSVPPVKPLPERRAVDRLLAPLDQFAEQSPHLLSKSLGRFESAGQPYTVPRYVYLGPKGGGDTIRIGIFAASLANWRRTGKSPKDSRCSSIRSAIRPDLRTTHATRAAARI
jgi:hypothetical protein